LSTKPWIDLRTNSNSLTSLVGVITIAFNNSPVVILTSEQELEPAMQDLDVCFAKAVCCGILQKIGTPESSKPFWKRLIVKD